MIWSVFSESGVFNLMCYSSQYLVRTENEPCQAPQVNLKWRHVGYRRFDEEITLYSRFLLPMFA